MSHSLVTGPITGEVVLADGSVVDVTPASIVLPTLEQVLEVADLIGKHWAQNGHPRVQGDFVYNQES